MDSACTSEMSISNHSTQQCRNPEDNTKTNTYHKNARTKSYVPLHLGSKDESVCLCVLTYIFY